MPLGRRNCNLRQIGKGEVQPLWKCRRLAGSRRAVMVNAGPARASQGEASPSTSGIP
jgi:methyl coenzyme M reductase beta subunit